MENNNTNNNQNNVVLPVGEEAIIINDNTNQNNNSNNDSNNQNQNNNQNQQQNQNNNQSDLNNQTQNQQQNNQTESTQIEIDGKDYNLDKDGNAIDSEGKVFMSKSKIDELTNAQNSNSTLIDQIQKINNIIINGEDGKPISYDSTPEGLAKRELDIINATRVNAQQEGVNIFLDNNPDFKSMYQYKQIHGSLEGYGNQNDYTTLTLDEKNKDQLKQVIIDEQLSKGSNPEVAKAFAEYAEKNNQLEALGKAAFNNLKNTQLEVIKAKQKQVKDWADNYYGVELDQNGNIVDLKKPGSLYDLIMVKGEFNGLKLPKDGIIVKNPDNTTTKFTNKQLFEFAAFSDQNGNSKMDNIINAYLSKAENKLNMALYILKGGDLSEFANAAVARNQAIKIKLSTQNNRSTSRDLSNNNNNNTSKEKVIVPIN